MDKIGLEGVAAELEEEGYAKESIDKYLELFELLKDRKDVAEGVAFLKDKLGDFLDQEVADSLTEMQRQSMRQRMQSLHWFLIRHSCAA